MQFTDDTMKLSDITVVRDTGGEWEGIYYQGKILGQDDSLDFTDFFPSINVIHLDMDSVDISILPVKLSDLPNDKEVKRDKLLKEAVYQKALLDKEIARLNAPDWTPD